MSPKRTLFIFSGCTGSGKTALSKPLAEKAGLPWTSFGNAVRSEAARAGLDPNDRAVLQVLGQKLVDCEPEKLCEIVIQELRSEDGSVGVLDGLRHEKIFEIIRNRSGASQCLLIYVDVETSLRHDRLKESRGLTSSQCEEFDRAATEAEVNGHLKAKADLVIDNNGSLYSATLQLQRWVESLA
jgi:dephospho-CoA kinase